MRAMAQEVYGAVEDLRLVEVQKPTPARGTILVRVRAAGVDPGIWHMVTGRPYMVRLMGLGVFRPKTTVAGWDVAGVVEAVGAGVTRLKPGDEVFGNCGGSGTGSFAEYTCLPEDRCALKPAGLRFEEAAALPVSGCTALQAVREVCKVEAGMTVLVLGAAGGVGHYAVQIAKARGARVSGVCGPSKLELVRSLGADEAIDYSRETLGASARRWDAIIDTAGRRGLGELRHALAPEGVAAIVGGEGGNPWTGGFLERILAGSLVSLFSKRKLVALNARVTVADLEALCELVESGKLKPALDRLYPLAEAPAALAALAAGHARGKSVVVVE
jgi:NADPH:quinone reductase-like Zn-dependent oxidoreductase